MEGAMSLYPYAHFNHISWPSLYNPANEVGFVGPPARPGGYYLSDPDEIFKFTLYWTLIFYLPLNFVAGLYAFFNFLFPPARSTEAIVLSPVVTSHSRSQSQSHSRSHSHSHTHSHNSHSHSPPPVDEWVEPPRTNPRGSRLTFSLLALLTFLVFSLLRAVVGAAVLSFVLVGVYRAGGFYMSTWIPFVWAMIQSLIALLEIWPSIIDII